MFDSILFWFAVIALYLSNQLVTKSKYQLILISLVSPFLFYNFFGMYFVLFTILTLVIIVLLSNGVNLFFFKLEHRYALLLFLVLIIFNNERLDFQLIGFSYFIIRFYDYIQSNRSIFLKANLQNKIVNSIQLYSYLFPIHGILAGPLLQYDKYKNFKTCKISFLSFQKAIFFILSGLIYKNIIAFYLSNYIDGLIVNSFYKSSLTLFYVFFDFAGYSLIAIGVGVLIGYQLPINFNNPFTSKSIGEFFERWHISLSIMAKKHVFNPFQLFLIRGRLIKNINLISSLSIILTFLIIALCHKLSINFFYWGLFLGIVLSFEHLLKLRKKIDNFLKDKTIFKICTLPLYIYTFVVISFSYFLLGDDLYNMIT